MWLIRKATIFCSIITLFMMVACAEDGETGAIGPVGPEGPTGPAGGNIIVNTYTVDSADWVLGRTAKENVHITQEVVDGGVVLAYRTPNAPNADSEWTSLFDGTFNFSYVRRNIIFLTPGFAGAGFTTYFKVVIIPPTSRIKNFEPKTYEEAKMVYGFED